jgi:hypothetical protein
MDFITALLLGERQLLRKMHLDLIPLRLRILRKYSTSCDHPPNR